MWYILALLLVLAECRFTIHVSTLTDHYSLTFPSHKTISVQNIRDELKRQHHIHEQIALCAPARRSLFHTDYSTELELSSDRPVSAQGVTWSLLSPFSITLAQNFVVVRDTVAEKSRVVTACRGSMVNDILSRVSVEEWYPKGTVLVEGGKNRLVKPSEVKPVGDDVDQIVEIQVKPNFTAVSGQYLWVPVGWIDSFLIDKDKVTMSVNKEPRRALFGTIDNSGNQFIRTANVKVSDNHYIIGAIPTAVTQSSDKVHILTDVQYGVLFDGQRIYEIVVPSSDKTYIEAVIGAQIIDLGEFTKDPVNLASIKPTQINQLYLSTASIDTSNRESLQHKLSYLDRLKLRWKSSQPESKAVILATIMFVIGAIAAVVYIAVNGSEQDDPVLSDIERDLDAVDDFQRRHSPHQ